jgi:hypothetical protein
MTRPAITDQSELGAMGIRIVDGIVHDHLRYLFRPREKRDLGIDGEIELVDEQAEKRLGTGRLIAVQIKCGLSFFNETDGEAYVYRGENKHFGYWSDFSLPVLIVICHPETREAYWVEFSPHAERFDKGWKVRIPLRNRLVDAGYELDRIGRRNHLDDLLDLAVQAWVHARFAERVEFCGIFQLPRDYHLYRHLIQVGSELVMLHWLYARYGSFELAEIRDTIQYLPGNKRYASKLLLCLVSESAEAFRLDAEVAQLLESENSLKVVRLIYRRDESLVGELEADGKVSIEYFGGEPVYRESQSGEWV